MPCMPGMREKDAWGAQNAKPTSYPDSTSCELEEPETTHTRGGPGTVLKSIREQNLIFTRILIAEPPQTRKTSRWALLTWSKQGTR